MKKSKLNLIKKAGAFDVTLYKDGVVQCGELTLRGDFALSETHTLDRQELTNFISGLTADILIDDVEGLSFNGIRYALPDETSDESYESINLTPLALIEAEDLKADLKVTIPIAKNAGDSVRVIQSVHMEGYNAQVKLVACDGYRLVQEAAANQLLHGDFKINVPVRTAELLYSLIEKDQVYMTDTCFWSKTFRLDFESEKGDYIDWKHFYKVEGTDMCHVEKSDLVQALKTLKPMCKDGKDYKPVKLDFTEEGLKLTPHKMDTTVTVPYVCGENPKEYTTHYLNPAYLLDFVGNMSRYIEKVAIVKTRTMDPMFFAEFFIMPMRNNN